MGIILSVSIVLTSKLLFSSADRFITVHHLCPMIICSLVHIAIGGRSLTAGCTERPLNLPTLLDPSRISGDLAPTYLNQHLRLKKLEIIVIPSELYTAVRTFSVS